MNSSLLHYFDLQKDDKSFELITPNVINGDCIEVMKTMDDKSFDMILTDIPYDGVNRESNGLRELDKKEADIITFKISDFLEQCERLCKGTIIIFCGMRQFSEIYDYFLNLQMKDKGTVRQLIWNKTNPSPMNGQYIYLSGIENAVWFKFRGGKFNAHCKNTVFTYPCGESKLHPTEKNHMLLRELVLDNSEIGDKILDPCCGSGSHLLVGYQNGRNTIGIELNPEYYNKTLNRFGISQAQ